MDMIRIVGIGGGNGLLQVAAACGRELKYRLPVEYCDGVEFTGITTAFDDGGSSGKQGIGYLGDLTQCVAAMSRDRILRVVLPYRFKDNDENPGDFEAILSCAVRRVVGEYPEVWRNPDRDASIVFRHCRELLIKHCVNDLGEEVLKYRFDQPFLGPDSVKNLFRISFEKVMERHDYSFRDVNRFFSANCLARDYNDLPHIMIPVTNCKSVLKARTREGNIIAGENCIENYAKLKGEAYDYRRDEIVEYFLDPVVPALPEVLEALSLADIITLGPGSNGGSILAPLLTLGMKEAFVRTLDKKPPPEIVLVANLMTTGAEAPAAVHHSAEVFLEMVQRAIGRSVTRVICDNTKLSPKAKLRYLGERKVHAAAFKYPNDPTARHPKKLQRAIAPWLLKRRVAKELEDGRMVHDPHLLAAVFSEILRSRVEAFT